MPRLARLRLVSVGHEQARMDDLLLDFRDRDGKPTDSTLWLRNGGGKSSILNLFFALLRPSRRDFLGGKADSRRRSLEDYVLPQDHAVVVAEWELDRPSGTLDLAEPTARLLTGVFYEWRTPQELRRLFFSGRVADAVTLESLPLTREQDGGSRRRLTMASFRQEWTALRERLPHLQCGATEVLSEWIQQLEAAGLDPDLFKYQIKMNLREGGADELFRFGTPEEFVDFLLELVLDPALADRISKNIAVYREQLLERRDRRLPERDLVQGLVQRLKPLRDIAEDRASLSGELADASTRLFRLRRWVDERLTRVCAELIEVEDAERRHAAEAHRLRREVDVQSRDAAVMRLAAAQIRLARVDTELAQQERVQDEAKLVSSTWDAAIPLRNARRFEQQAAMYRKDLERNQHNEAPLLVNLRRAAGALAAALAHEIQTLRRAQEDALETKRRSRDAARALEQQAKECTAAISRADTQIAQMERQEAMAAAARGELESRGALVPGERGGAAMLRLGDQIEQARQAELDLRAAIEEQRARLGEISRHRVEALARAQMRQEQARVLRTGLQAATDRRRQIEDDPLLARVLEVEALDIERASGEILNTLEARAWLEQERGVLARVEREEDQRSVKHLEEHGLLPPSPDVHRVLEAIRARLPAAWSAWEWIEQNIRRDQRREFVIRAPELASGVIVRDADFEKAQELLAKSGVAPDAPVVLLTATAAKANPSPSPGPRAVLGPASDAWYEKTSAEEELRRRRARLDQIDAKIRDAAALHRQILDLAMRVREFRREHPRGWFGAEEHRLLTAEAEAADAHTRTLELETEHASTEQRINGLEERREVRQNERLRCEADHHRVELYVRDHEAPAADLQNALAQARQASKVQAAELERLQRDAAQRDMVADAAEQQAGRHGEEARAREEELRAVEYVEAEQQPHATPGPLDEYRDTYQHQKRSYEERVGKKELLQLARQADDNAREERRKLNQLLRDGVTEAEARRLLDSLDDPTRAEEEAQRARELHASARGLLGALSRDHKQAKERLADAQRACTRWGDVSEFLSGDLPASADEADLSVEQAEASVAQLTAEAALEDAAQKQSAARGEGLKHRRSGLEKDRNRLSTIESSYSHLLSGGTAEPPPVELDDETFDSHLDELDTALRNARARAEDLDRRCQGAARLVRAWAGEARFERLHDSIAQQFRSLEDQELERSAARWSGQLELRLEHVSAQLAEMDRHRDVLVGEVVSVAEEGLKILQKASTHSTLPEHVPGLGGAQFLRITCRPPDDPGERRGRIGDLVDELIGEHEVPGGVALVQQAVRRLARPIEVRVLNPDPALGRRYVGIAEMARFSGGEQLTGAILLYCTLAQLRARQRAMARKPSSVLLLDNPIGRASRPKFLELQREVARAMGVQLIYTTGVNDFDAMHALPNVIRLRNERIDRNRGHRVVEHHAGEGAIEAARVVRPDAPKQTVTAVEEPTISDGTPAR